MKFHIRWNWFPVQIIGLHILFLYHVLIYVDNSVGWFSWVLLWVPNNSSPFANLFKSLRKQLLLLVTVLIFMSCILFNFNVIYICSYQFSSVDRFNNLSIIYENFTYKITFSFILSIMRFVRILASRRWFCHSSCETYLYA